MLMMICQEGWAEGRMMQGRPLLAPSLRPLSLEAPSPASKQDNLNHLCSQPATCLGCDNVAATPCLSPFPVILCIIPTCQGTHGLGGSVWLLR